LKEIAERISVLSRAVPVVHAERQETQSLN